MSRWELWFVRGCWLIGLCGVLALYGYCAHRVLEFYERPQRVRVMPAHELPFVQEMIRNDWQLRGENFRLRGRVLELEAWQAAHRTCDERPPVELIPPQNVPTTPGDAK